MTGYPYRLGAMKDVGVQLAELDFDFMTATFDNGVTVSIVALYDCDHNHTDDWREACYYDFYSSETGEGHAPMPSGDNDEPLEILVFH